MSQITITLPTSIGAKIGHRIAVEGQKEKQTHELNWSLNLESNDHQDRNALVLNLVQAGITNLLRTLKPNDLPDNSESADKWIQGLSQSDLYSAAMETARAGRKQSDYPLENRREDCQRIAGLATAFNTKLAKDFRKLINPRDCAILGVSTLRKQIGFILDAAERIQGEESEIQPVKDAHIRFAEWLESQAQLIESSQEEAQFE